MTAFWTPGETVQVDGPVIELGDLILNEVDDSGVAWAVNPDGLSGWTKAASTTEATQRVADHGAWLTRPYYAARQIGVAGWVDAPSKAACRDAESRLARALRLTDFQLVVREHGLNRAATVRQLGQPDWAYLGDGTSANFSVSLIAADPFRYSIDQRTATAVLPSITGGWSPPMTFPFHIGATVAKSHIALFNGGDEPARPLVTIRGPVVDPIVQIPETGVQMRFRINLGAGDALEVDCRRGSIILNNSVTRRHTMLGSTFLALPPGWSSVRYGGGSYSPASSVTLAWKDTWA